MSASSGSGADVDVAALAQELEHACAQGQGLPDTFSERLHGFNLDIGYQVEAELVRRRRQQGHATRGRKVGYANKALWRALKLETLVWAHMYDDTVVMATDNHATLPIGRMRAPKIEPEIVFKLGAPIGPGATDPAAVLASVEWLALGFEIVDCPFPNWTFQPADFVAAYGLHAALVVGAPCRPDAALVPQLIEQLSSFRVRLLQNGTPSAEGSGRNCLRSPALCLGTLAEAIATRTPDEPLAAGELVSSGSLTEAQAITPGQTWTAHIEGLPIGPLTVDLT